MMCQHICQKTRTRKKLDRDVHTGPTGYMGRLVSPGHMKLDSASQRPNQSTKKNNKMKMKNGRA